MAYSARIKDFKGASCHFDLRTDDLEQQSDETIAFIHSPPSIMTTCTCGHFRSAHHFPMPYGPGRLAPCMLCRCRHFTIKWTVPGRPNDLTYALKRWTYEKARRTSHRAFRNCEMAAT